MSLGMSALAASERFAAWRTKYVYAQLHTGDPGANGTANIATNTTRKLITWASSADTSVAGVVTLTHTNDLAWTSVPATEDYAYVSVHSASTGGDFGGSGSITADPVTASQNWTLPAGSLIVNEPVAA
jgi:hypothetical protein